jgi:hypothetical protein
MKYADQLKDFRWQERSQKIKEAAGRRCEECGEDEKRLDVHHSYYQNGLLAWEYPDEALHCLCGDCHEIRAQEERELMKAIHPLTRWQLYELSKHIRMTLAGEMPEGTYPPMSLPLRPRKRGWDLNEIHQLPQ